MADAPQAGTQVAHLNLLVRAGKALPLTSWKTRKRHNVYCSVVKSVLNGKAW